MKDDIYKMKLGEQIHDWDNKKGNGRVVVYRVPGGWIFCFFQNGTPYPCFVPFSAEFQNHD